MKRYIISLCLLSEISIISSVLTSTRPQTIKNFEAKEFVYRTKTTAAKMRFTTASATTFLSATAAALPAEPIQARQDLNTQCSNLGESWCVDGRTWTCCRITFDRGLAANTYKDCGAKSRGRASTPGAPTLVRLLPTPQTPYLLQYFSNALF